MTAQRPLGPKNRVTAPPRPGVSRIAPSNKKTAARIFVARALDEHVAHRAIAYEPLPALQQPRIPFPYGRAQIAYQFSVVSLGIIHEEARCRLKVLAGNAHDDCVMCRRDPRSICDR